MKSYDFDVVIEKKPEDEGYYAYIPGLPGCFSNGRTIEETRRNIRETVQQHIATLHAHGEPAPQVDSTVYVERLSLGLP